VVGRVHVRRKAGARKARSVAADFLARCILSEEWLFPTTSFQLDDADLGLVLSRLPEMGGLVGSSGVELARRVHEQYPAVKIVLASGFPLAALRRQHGDLSASLNLTGSRMLRGLCEPDDSWP
jgi:hypothetical protein